AGMANIRDSGEHLRWAHRAAPYVPILIRPASTSSRCGFAIGWDSGGGIFTQPASSKNHERRSSLTKMADADEKMETGMVSPPAKAFPQYCASAMQSSELESSISIPEDRAGMRSVIQRNAPASSRPKTKSVGSDMRMAFGESRSSTRSESGNLKTEVIEPSAMVLLRAPSLTRRSGRTAYPRKRFRDNLSCVM